MRESALLLAGIGFAIAVLLAFPALVISGVGHGWTAPIAASLWAVPVLPLLGISWTYRHQARGRDSIVIGNKD